VRTTHSAITSGIDLDKDVLHFDGEERRYSSKMPTKMMNMWRHLACRCGDSKAVWRRSITRRRPHWEEGDGGLRGDKYGTTLSRSSRRPVTPSPKNQLSFQQFISSYRLLRICPLLYLMSVKFWNELSRIMI
jgi:hypothetical protein